METKHTKGEWKLFYPTENDPNAFTIGDADGFCLASVYGADGNVGEINEAEANAKLIAAAPKMLTALQKVADKLAPHIHKLGVKKGFSELLVLNEVVDAINATK